jgi:hypothetical protein
MRKILLITFLVLSSSITLKAQKNAIKTNMLSPLFGRFSISYERAFSEKTSLQVSSFYAWRTPNFDIWSGTSSEWTGFGFTPEFRFYPSGNGINGFYLAPYLRYVRLTSASSYDYGYYDQNYNYVYNPQRISATDSKFGGGLMVGRQWILGDLISFDIFMGPGIINRTTKVSGSPSDNYYPYYNEDGPLVDFRLGANLGIAF